MVFLYFYQFSLYSMLSNTHNFCPICCCFCCVQLLTILHTLLSILSIRWIWFGCFLGRCITSQRETGNSDEYQQYIFVVCLLRECKQRILQIFSSVISVCLILYFRLFDTLLPLESNKFRHIYRTKDREPEENKNVVYVGMGRNG